MKRYRVVDVDFDTRATFLSEPISAEWTETSQRLRRVSRRKIERELLFQFGFSDGEQKRQNFVDLGSKPISIIAFHNKFFEQIRWAFVQGAYYPALTAACALGERTFNHLILTLRDDFKGTDGYKRVKGKNAVIKWNIAIEVLSDWKVLQPKAKTAIKRLKKIRDKAIHFHPETDSNDRELALNAIRVLGNFLDAQFSGWGTHPWFMSIPGEIYIKKRWESRPFISKIYLPNSLLVGPDHRVVQVTPDWKIEDRDDYPKKSISDKKFLELRQGTRGD